METNPQPFMQLRVVLLGWSTRSFELFMGGVLDGVVFQWDFPLSGDPDDDPYPTENKDPSL